MMPSLYLFFYSQLTSEIGKYSRSAAHAAELLAHCITLSGGHDGADREPLHAVRLHRLGVETRDQKIRR
jgi:hypothetical protein